MNCVIDPSVPGKPKAWEIFADSYSWSVIFDA